MKSTGFRRVAAAGAGVAMLATAMIGLTATPASASATGGAKPAVLPSKPEVSPKHFVGACPATVSFSSKIKVRVKGTTKVAYQWLHGDGSKSKVKVVTLRGHGTKTITVREQATFKKSVKGWQALRVLAPYRATTKKSHFSVACAPKAKPVQKRALAKAFVDVPNYSGICAPSREVRAEGLIRVNRPTLVRYRWIHNGKVVDHGKVKVRNAKKVSYAFAPRHSHKGWVALDIVSPRHSKDDRDFYRVDCARPAPKPAKAWASVSGPGFYQGACPVARTFTGTVGANRPTVVKYRWVGHGYRGPVETAFVGKHGRTKTVSHTVRFRDNGTAKRWIEVLSPNRAVSNSGVTKVVCGAAHAKPTPKPHPKPHPKPVTDGTAQVLDVKVAADNSTCVDTKGPKVNVTGRIQVTGAARVNYRWSAGNASRSGVLVVHNAGVHTVSFSIDPGTLGSTTSGTVTLEVTSPSSSSVSESFSFTCPKKA